MVWTPAQLVGAADTGGLIDLATPAGLYQDSAGTTPVSADLQPLGRLVAKANAGTALVLTQATSSAKPTWRDLNPRRATFDGGDWLTLGAGRFGRAGLFAGPGESWSIVFAGSPGNGSLLARALNADATKRTLQWYNNGTQAAPVLGAHVRGATNQAIAQPAGLGAVFVAGLRWDGATLRTRVNNTLGTLSVGTAAEESTDINLGGRANGTISVLTSGSWLGQAFLIDRYLSDQEWDWLFYTLSQAVGLSGIGTAPPAPSVVLDAVTAAAPTPVAISSLVSAPVLEAALVAASAMPTASALVGHPLLGAASAYAQPLFETASLVSAAGLGDAGAAAPTAIVAATLQSAPVLGSGMAAAPTTVNAGALAGQPALGAVNACAPAGMGITGLGGEQALGSCPVEAPAMTLTAGLVSAPIVGAALSCAPAVPLAAMLATAPTLGGAETVGLAAVTPAELALFVPEPLRSARLASRDAAPRLHSRDRAGLASRSAAPILTTRAA